MKVGVDTVQVVNWLTVAEASRVAGVDEDTIRRWADSARIEAMRTLGGHRRIDGDNLEQVLRSGGTVERDIDPVTAVEQFGLDGTGWYGWTPPEQWSEDRTDEFIGAVDDARRSLASLRDAAIAHLDRVGG